MTDSIRAFPKRHDKDNQEEEKNSQTVAGKRLISFLERIERLEEEKAATSDDIKDVYSEAKSTGFDTKTMRKLIRLRKMNIEKRREEEELLETYKTAIGLE